MIPLANVRAMLADWTERAEINCDDPSGVEFDLARDVLTLAAALETAERERDEAREVAVRLGEVCERQARMLARAPSFEDAMALCIHAIVEPATDAPNCAEWRGTMRGRGFVLSLQWADGKSPQTLLSEAMAERDTARSAHAELAAAVRAEREAAVDAIVRCARTVRGLAEEIVDATTRADATEADRDYWRAQATMAAPCVDAVRALGSRLIPGGTGCAVDPERVVAAAEGLRREAALATMERDTLRGLSDALRADNARLRAIVEGRTVAPTLAEARAHAAAGGRWTLSHDHDGRRLVYTLDADVDDVRPEISAAWPGARWIPLDATGRPCPWPTALDAGEGQ